MCLTLLWMVLFAGWFAPFSKAVTPLDGFDHDVGGPVYAMGVQDDGKVLIGGFFYNHRRVWTKLCA